MNYKTALNFLWVIFISSVLFSFIFALFNQYWSDGDELHYLVMSHSIIEDKDLNIYNNYYEAKTYLEHHGFEVEGHGVLTNETTFYSHHQPLVSFIAALGYIIRGLLGARIVMWLLHLLGVLLVWQVLKSISISIKARLVVLSLYVVSLPVVAYAQYVYTDLFSGYVVLLMWYTLVRAYQSKKQIWYLISGVISGLAIFLHVKLLIFSAAMYLGYLGYTFSKEKGQTNIVAIKRYLKKYKISVLLVLSPWIGSLLIFCYINYKWTGIFRPDAILQLSLNMPGASIQEFFDYSILHIITSILGLFWDTENGLFYNAPVLILAFPGFACVWRKNKKICLVVVTVSLLLILRQASFIVWRTWGPPARYLMAFAPSMLITAALAIDQIVEKAWGKLLIALGFVYSISLSLTMFFAGKSGYPLYQGDNVYLSKLLETVNLKAVENIITINIHESHSAPSDFVRAAVLSAMVIFVTILFFKQNAIKDRI